MLVGMLVMIYGLTCRTHHKLRKWYTKRASARQPVKCVQKIPSFVSSPSPTNPTYRYGKMHRSRSRPRTQRLVWISPSFQPGTWTWTPAISLVLLIKRELQWDALRWANFPRTQTIQTTKNIKSPKLLPRDQSTRPSVFRDVQRFRVIMMNTVSL